MRLKHISPFPLKRGHFEVLKPNFSPNSHSAPFTFVLWTAILHNQSSEKMPVKVVDATISNFNTVFDKFRSELQNNKANFILFLADNDPSTSLSWCPGTQTLFNFLLFFSRNFVDSVITHLERIMKIVDLTLLLISGSFFLMEICCDYGSVDCDWSRFSFLHVRVSLLICWK